MNYHITYINPNTQYIPIKAEFDVSGQEKMILQFPVWRPGRYERGDFSKNIHGFKITSGKSKIRFKKITKDSWEVDCKGVDQIEVAYKYYAAELNAGSTFMDDQQLYVNPVNCLIYIPEQQNQECHLGLTIPDDFQIASGAKFKDNTAIFDTYHELVDSPFIASNNLEHLNFECKGVLFHLWFQGEVKLEDKVIADIEKYTISQISKFGQFPVNEYHYLYQIQAIPSYHGVEHSTSTVISLGPTYDLMGKLYDDFLGVSSHELYHTWNVKALRPIEWHPYDYSKENYSVLGYVAEGVTTYMGDLFLVESGVKDWKWYRIEFEKLMQKHFDNFGRFNYSVAESSLDTWLDGYVAGAPNRKVSIYNEGALLSFMLDAKIRTNSNNKFSLHDVMKELYEQFAMKNIGYSEADFKGVVEQFADENLNEFFEQYYYGTHSFETVLTKGLEEVGLSIEMTHNSSWATRILGAKCQVENGKTIVKQLYPGSSADLAGLIIGDEITYINAYRLNRDLDKWCEFYQDEQIELVINRKGRKLDLICPHTNKSFFPSYKIVKSKAPSNVQKRIFKKWCGTEWDEI
jgi:predicted metalloprotease with PDZ domain